MTIRGNPKRYRNSLVRRVLCLFEYHKVPPSSDKVVEEIAEELFLSTKESEEYRCLQN